MTATRRARGVLPYLVGAVTALAGARVFAPRGRRDPEDPFGEAVGRGSVQTPPSTEAREQGFETEDASGRDLGWTMAVFALCALTGVAMMVGYLAVLHRGDVRREAGLTSVQRAQTPPPLPHLQADPLGEIAAQRAAQLARLHGYARLDANTARIPIERAMALVVGQSLDAHAVQESPR